MFHTMLTLAYTIPGLYLFVRIWQLFITRERRLKYVLVFLFIFSIYPLSELFQNNDAGLPVRILIKTANYLLPFFLYVFLLVLLTDLLLLINSLLRLFSRDRVKDRLKTGGILYLIMLIAAAIVVAGIINLNTIRATEYRITVPARSSELEELRIAFISDFHLDEESSPDFVKRFTEEIGEIKPDILLYGGDIVEGNNRGENMMHLESLLRSVSTRFGIYGVPGNHDRYSRRGGDDFFSRSGIIMLTDSTIVVKNSFTLAGRNDSRTRFRKSAAEMAETAPDSLPLIMIDHRPTEIEQISRTKTDISLSGHTHHGQLFPVNIFTSRVYRLSYGYLKEGHTHFFVSSGIRLWGPPVRTTAKSEIVVVDVKFSSDLK